MPDLGLAMTARQCAYCPNLAIRRAQCPRGGGICDWCCDSCSGSKCATGRTTTRYPAAERFALGLMLAVDAELAETIAAWRAEYSRCTGCAPGDAETKAATDLLAQRLDGRPPAVPPSASSTALRIPAELRGIPGSAR